MTRTVLIDDGEFARLQQFTDRLQRLPRTAQLLVVAALVAAVPERAVPERLLDAAERRVS